MKSLWRATTALLMAGGMASVAMAAPTYLDCSYMTVEGDRVVKLNVMVDAEKSEAAWRFPSQDEWSKPQAVFTPTTVDIDFFTINRTSLMITVRRAGSGDMMKGQCRKAEAPGGRVF